jgi:hypothetical protein
MSDLDEQVKKFCDAGFYLVAIPSIDGKPTKAPKNRGWNKPKSNDNPNGYSNDPIGFQHCKGFNIGLFHGASKTVAFDIDSLERTRQIFEEATDIKLRDWLEDDLRFEIKSPKPNHGKLLFRLPIELDVSLKQLNHNDEMIFELRCGNCQDVIHGQHPEGGNYQIIGNPVSIPEAPPILLDMLQHWDDWKLAFDSVLNTDAEQPEYKPHKPQKRENIKGWRNPIVEFNQSHTCAAVLIRNGYRQVGKDRFIRPNSSSKVAGVVVLNNYSDAVERVYSHGGDVLNDGFAHDAFDCMRFLEHGGKW